MNTRAMNQDFVPGRVDDIHSYRGVRTRRIFAFMIDYLIIGLLLVPFGILVFLLGLLTFGLAWSLFAGLAPIVALIYVWFTLGGPNQATTGMRLMGVRLERLDGGPIDGLTAVVHTVLFWAGNVLLTPFILLVTLFSARKRALHDILLGTVVVRS